MNENVTIKTPKRRRWIARLLVSALCILLASSLLFVGVVADVVSLVKLDQYSLTATANTSQFVCVGEDCFVFVLGGILSLVKNGYIVDSLSLSNVAGVTGITNYIFSLAFDPGSSRLYLCNFQNYYFCLFTVNIKNYSFLSSSFARFLVSGITEQYYNCSIAVENGKLVGILYDHVLNGTDDMFFSWYLGDFTYTDYSFRFSNRITSSDNFLIRSTSVAFNGVYYFPAFGCAMDFEGNILFQLDFPVGVRNGLFVFNDSVCITGNGYIYSYSSSGGLSASYQYFDFYTSGRITGISSDDNLTLCQITTGGSTFYTASFKDASPPPESSDETTTEPPPESSEESSEPDVTMTKIWKYEPGSDGTSVSTAIGEVDLNDAVKVEAFLGRFESSSDNSDWTDSPQNLMLRVTNSDDTEDIYQFDFPAFGYYSGLLSSEVEFSDFVFPGFVGYWFEIPFENGSEISFATKSPGGSVFLYGYNMQLTVNFNSPDSSFRLLFGQDSYSVVLSNIGENSQIVVFEDETVLRYKKFTVNGGSSWYAPEEGTFALFPASDVLDPNILLSSIRIETNIDNTIGFPTESFLESVSKWEEYLSRQEDKQDFLNSLAGDAYDQISIDPDTSEAYGDAVDTFSTIVNSEGGSAIFGFFRYMWSVHPLMSSMVSLVVSFSIVGFIVRKV